jgi:hypothetical protein
MEQDVTATMVLMHPMTPEGTVELIHTLIRQRDQARRIAAHLEAECALWTESDYKHDYVVLLSNAWRTAALDRDKYRTQNEELIGRLNRVQEAIHGA